LAEGLFVPEIFLKLAVRKPERLRPANRLV
jgi:hypothetical protein